MNEKKLNILNKLKAIYGDVYSKYTITMIMVNVSTVIGCIYAVIDEASAISSGGNFFRMTEWLLLFFLFFTFGCLCIESIKDELRTDNKTLKITVCMVMAGLISAFLVSLLCERFFGLISIDSVITINENRMISWIYAYFVITALLTFYFRYKESGASIEKYFVSVFTEIIQIGIAWGVLAIGFVLLSLVFDELLGSVIGLYIVPQILIVGLYVVPRFILGITNVTDEIGRFFEILIKYVMLVITIIGAAIIYLYIIKLIFTGIPSNEIFAITSVLFFVSIPVGFACTAFDKDTVLQKIAYILPYVYAPFIALQAYSIIVRIIEYGITPSRYMGIVLIVLEIIYTVVYALFRQNIDKIILIMVAITVIITLVPIVNVDSLSKISQKRFLTESLNNGYFPDDSSEQNKILGSYKYLLDEYGKKYVDGFLSEDIQMQILEIDEHSFSNQTIEYRMNSDEDCIPTEGYKYFAEFYSALDYPKNTDTSPSNMVIIVNEKPYGTYDLSDEYESVKKRCIDANASAIEGQDVVKLSDDCAIVITNARISENVTDNSVTEYKVSGYYLTNTMSED